MTTTRLLKIWRNETDGKNQTVSVWKDRKVRTGYYVKDYWQTLMRSTVPHLTDEEWLAKPVGEGWKDITPQ